MKELVGDFKDQLIKVSGIGQDRPGIVHKIASVIKSNGGNIILQRSMKVAGEFAIIVVASFETENLSAAENVNKALGGGALGDNFYAFARAVSRDNIAIETEGGTKYAIIISGPDRMGIVEEVTQLLIQFSLNLDSMDSEVTYSPFQGTMRFTSTFVITVPENFDMEAFETELSQFESNADLTAIIKRL